MKKEEEGKGGGGGEIYKKKLKGIEDIHVLLQNKNKGKEKKEKELICYRLERMTKDNDPQDIEPVVANAASLVLPRPISRRIAHSHHGTNGNIEGGVGRQRW